MQLVGIRAETNLGCLTLEATHFTVGNILSQWVFPGLGEGKN